MNTEQKLISLLQQVKRNIFFNSIPKLAFLFIFNFIGLIFIFEKIKTQEILTAIFFIIAEILCVSFFYFLLKEANESSSIKKSRIFNAFKNKDIVTEIIIKSEKIVFELKGMEDESIYIKNSKIKEEIISHLKEIFGESKVIEV